MVFGVTSCFWGPHSFLPLVTEPEPGRDAGGEDTSAWCCRRMSSAKSCWHMLTHADHHLFQQDMIRTKHTLHAVAPSRLPFLHFPLHQQHLIAALLTTRISVCTPCVCVVIPSTLIQHKLLIQNCILSRHAHTLKNRSHGHAQVIFALTALYHWKQPFQFAGGVQESLVS